MQPDEYPSSPYQPEQPYPSQHPNEQPYYPQYPAQPPYQQQAPYPQYPTQPPYQQQGPYPPYPMQSPNQQQVPYPQYPPQPYPPAPGYGYDPLTAQPVTPYNYGNGQPPTEPPKRRNFLGAIIALVLAFTLIVGFSGALYLRSHGTVATTTVDTAGAIRILNGVGQSDLRDTSFAVTGNISESLTFQGKAQTLNTTLSGSGAITKSPSRMRLTLGSSATGITAGSTTIEEIIDSTAIYIKEPLLTKDPKKPWLKIDVKGMLGNSSGLSSSNVLDFSQLRGQRIIGEELINGKKAWHVQATLSDLLNNGTPGPSATLTAVAQKIGVQDLTFTEDVWIFEDSSYPARISVHESLAFGGNSATATPSPLAGDSSTIDETLTFTAWNSGVKIDLPPDSQVSPGFGK
jgi:hypothetical protein